MNGGIFFFVSVVKLKLLDRAKFPGAGHLVICFPSRNLGKKLAARLQEIMIDLSGTKINIIIVYVRFCAIQLPAKTVNKPSFWLKDRAVDVRMLD